MAQENTGTAEIFENEIDLGTVKIADDVVAMIVYYATMEVEGVHDMAQAATSLLKNNRKGVKGVKIDLSDNMVKVDLALILDYGYNIPATSSKVQTKVKQAIENMTGLNVSDINVRIAGINMPDSAETAAE